MDNSPPSFLHSVLHSPPDDDFHPEEPLLLTLCAEDAKFPPCLLWSLEHVGLNMGVHSGSAGWRVAWISLALLKNTNVSRSKRFKLTGSYSICWGVKGKKTPPAMLFCVLHWAIWCCGQACQHERWVALHKSRSLGSSRWLLLYACITVSSSDAASRDGPRWGLLYRVGGQQSSFICDLCFFIFGFGFYLHAEGTLLLCKWLCANFIASRCLLVYSCTTASAHLELNVYFYG